MATKHTRVLKENWGQAIRQWGLPRAEKEMRREKAKPLAKPVVWEVCKECGAVKSINNKCQPCATEKALKKFEDRKAEKCNKKAQQIRRAQRIQRNINKIVGEVGD